MSTFLYLSNEASDLSGYLKMYVGQRPLNASSTISTTVTNTTGSGTHIAMTLTAGGTTAKWITPPLKAAVTIAANPFLNTWALESNAAANAEIQYEFSQYTTSVQTAFVLALLGTELTTAAARTAWINAATLTSTTFAAGDRIALLPYIVNNGTMGASRTVTLDYNKNATGVDGDTYFLFDEDFQVAVSQWGNGTTQRIPGGPALQKFEGLRNDLTAMQGIFWTAEARSEDILNELAAQRDLQGA